jgi:hypothetical protein
MPRSTVDPSLQSKHLFISHLAARLDAMERGALPLTAAAYRLYARRLREATAGYPEAQLGERLGRRHPVVAETSDNRYFDTHGHLPGAAGLAAREAAERLFERLSVA